MPVLPGAEPYHHQAGDTGVLFCHGFTGSPQSLRPWAERLAAHGLTVSLPLLPGHGTRWEDLAVTGWQDWYAEVDRELLALRRQCREVFVAGLSMGGTLALRLAARHGEGVAGVMVVNPANRVHSPLAPVLPVVKHLVRAVPGIADDIAKPGRRELGYARMPLTAVDSLRRFFRLVDSELPMVTQPLLLMTSRQDHTVPTADSARVLSRVSSTDVTRRVLEQSYHVATLDFDADLIVDESLAFVGRSAPAVGKEGTGTGG
ncbi:alpha/beta hydrolase [Streptomyces sp. NPDC050560]|uniref:alpha/beta hydrolase n=1 Tax=Streptomyces sp. NPDC050560 TaxID=3365630 RepID=UPI003789A9CC